MARNDRRLVILIAVVFFFVHQWRLASGSENAVLVVNGRSASSKWVANHYAQLRNVPRQNIIQLNEVPQKEVVSVNEFRDRILSPILAEISQRKIGHQIDYVIYSSDFPTIVNVKADVKNKKQPENQAKSLQARVFTPFVSITSATFFYQQILTKQIDYLSLNANTYARPEIIATLTRPFVGEKQEQFSQALSLIKEGQYEAAIGILDPLAEKNPKQLAVLYWLARVNAKKSDAVKCIEWLSKAIAAGWQYRAYTSSDPAFASLNDNEQYKSLIRSMSDIPARYAPSLSFSSRLLWGPNGMINSETGQGNRYLLSAMLAVNRNQGTSEFETLAYLNRSIQADGKKPSGTFYFTKTKDVRTKTRQKGIDEAIEELATWGHRGVIVNDKIPRGKQDIVGLTMGAAGFTWPRNNRIVPGAICENLTSFGGRLLPGTKQTKLTEFLRRGAAGSSGTVIEPFAIQAKFPHPRIHVHYVQGCTLAESFYQSVTGPFQLLVVGDPLCRPWADIPKVDVTGDLLSKEPLNGIVRFSVTGKQRDKPVQQIEMYVDGRLTRRLSGSKTGLLNVDTASLADGFHELRFVAISDGNIQTRGSKVVPIEIENRGQSVSLTCLEKVARIEEALDFQVKSPGAEQIQLLANGQEVSQTTGESADFSIPAVRMGRGPVKVEAIATFGDVLVRSVPLDVAVEGPISRTIPVLKKPAKKAKSAPRKKIR